VSPETTSPENPLLRGKVPIPFDEIQPVHVEPAVRHLIDEASTWARSIGEDPAEPNWDNTVAPFDALTRKVRRGTAPIHHLLAVAESPELREAWGRILPDYVRFWSRLLLDRTLLVRLEAIAENAAIVGALSPVEQRHLRRTIQDFRRAGAGLDEAGRAHLEALDVEVAELEQQFSEHVLDATAAFRMHIPADEGGRLSGIPDDALARFAERARAEEKEGWILTLDYPSLEAVLKHADDRELRRTLHAAHLARGAAAPLDNRPLIQRILAIRQARARLLGYADYPDYRLETHMARTGERARAFVHELVERTRPSWTQDLAALRAQALELGLDELRPWDVSWVAEKLRKARYDLDEEALRPYFPLPRVLDGMFEIFRRVFGFKVVPGASRPVWHPDVVYFEVTDEVEGRDLGGFYADFYPRPEKRQGAWMSDFIYGERREGTPPELHVGNLCTNFPPPTSDRPSLLSHRDVETLFHEFGHLLHHLASTVPLEGRGGTNVAWDWVELPSQLLENWTWEEEALALISGHWQTGEPLPTPLLDRMQAARRFLGGWMQMRQLTFGVMDLALHTDYKADLHGDPVDWVTERLLPLSADPTFAAAHPLPGFLHLFSGGYASSYYAYLWSEVLEADLFSRFRDEGIFDREVGRTFVETILSQGDAEDPEILFRRFMGRDPDPEALIRRNLP